MSSSQEMDQLRNYESFLENYMKCGICLEAFRPYIIECDWCQHNFCAVCILHDYCDTAPDDSDSHPDLMPVGSTIVVQREKWQHHPTKCPLCGAVIGPSFRRNKSLERQVEAYAEIMNGRVPCAASNLHIRIKPRVHSSFTGEERKDRVAGASSSPPRTYLCKARTLGCTWLSTSSSAVDKHQMHECAFRTAISYMDMVKQKECLVDMRRDHLQNSIPLVESLLKRFESVYEGLNRYANCKDFIFLVRGNNDTSANSVSNNAIGGFVRGKTTADSSVCSIPGTVELVDVSDNRPSVRARSKSPSRRSHSPERGKSSSRRSHCPERAKSPCSDLDSIFMQPRHPSNATTIMTLVHIYQYPIWFGMVPSTDSDEYYNLVLQMDTHAYRFSQNEIMRLNAFICIMTRGRHDDNETRKMGFINIANYKDSAIVEMEAVFSRLRTQFVCKHFLRKMLVDEHQRAGEALHLYGMFFVPTKSTRNSICSRRTGPVPTRGNVPALHEILDMDSQPGLFSGSSRTVSGTKRKYTVNNNDESSSDSDGSIRRVDYSGHGSSGIAEVRTEIYHFPSGASSSSSPVRDDLTSSSDRGHSFSSCIWDGDFDEED